MKYLLKVFQNVRYHSDHPVTFAEPEKLNSEYKDFLLTYMSDCSTSQHIHQCIKEFKLLKSQNVTSRQKVFALIYTRYNFPKKKFYLKNMQMPPFFNDIVNCFCDGHKVIHHSYITREIYGYIHNFCNKKVREMTDKNGIVRKVTTNNGQYFFCVFHNGFKFDMTFLTRVYGCPYGKLRTFLYCVVALPIWNLTT